MWRGQLWRKSLLTMLASTIHSRRGHQLWRAKRSALRLRLTGSVEQPVRAVEQAILPLEAK